MKPIVLLLALGGLLKADIAAQAQDPGNERAPQRPPGAFERGGPKICVCEMTPTKKVVYTTAEKEYCVRHKSIWQVLQSACGHGEPVCGPCEMHTRWVLIKKRVPGPDVPKCVVKDAPAGCSTCLSPGIVAPGMVPTPQPLPGSVPKR